ncbi:heparinase II/III family protein [Methylovirgula sp. 4M-Z18]|uniref:heparinase II/III family protein n=1 Tax=Methylovirgula sp. 4M-Z18 TaxID=2293567 RepID=UPI001314F7A9|nr:heparinase II/III family protein [Methylovirgula sp. 4M-Z18]
MNALQRIGLVSPWRTFGRFSTAVPSRLIIAPPDIRTSDPTIASDIYAGYFSFEGRVVNTHGQSPFAIEPPSADWARRLNEFGWLRHQRGAGSALSRENARALVTDWIAICGKARRGHAWEARVIARRILSWLSQSPLLLEGADRSFYQQFLKSLARQATVLRRRMQSEAQDERVLFGAIALAELGLCAEGLASLARLGTQLLAQELQRQILPDGGHISRNPRILIDLMLDLLPLRQAYGARGQQAPVELLNTIDRIIPMLRMFRHGDGSLALFNGMGVTAPDILATILAYDDAQGVAITNARYSGYQRIESGGSIVIMDTGRAPPPVFSLDAHAGALSFEFSSRQRQIIVNCGAPEKGRQALRELTRATAAHSTLVVNDTSSCRIAPAAGQAEWLGGQILAGPRHVPVARQDALQATEVTAAHDGYTRPMGLIHQRKVKLSADGKTLTGEDKLLPAPRRRGGKVDRPYAVRFHLHPSVQVRRAASEDQVLLVLPGGETWRFMTMDAPITFEESIYVGAADGLKRTHQLVVQGQSGPRPVLKWMLHLVADAKGQGA